MYDIKFELKELKRRDQEREEEERRKQEEAAAAEAAKLAKATPVTSPDEPPSDRSVLYYSHYFNFEQNSGFASSIRFIIFVLFHIAELMAKAIKAANMQLAKRTVMVSSLSLFTQFITLILSVINLQ